MSKYVYKNKVSFRVTDFKVLQKIGEDKNKSRVINEALKRYYSENFPMEDHLSAWIEILRQLNGVARNVNQIALATNAMKRGVGNAPDSKKISISEHELRLVINGLYALVDKWS